MKIIYLFISIFIFYGCSFSKLSVKKSQNSSDVYDLTHIPQNISSFTNALRDAKELYESQKNYNDGYFYVWNDFTFPPIEKNMWAFKNYKLGDSYGENLNLLEKDFFKNMLTNANFQAYKTINKYALTIKNLNMRAFPTSKPLLKDPSKAGEGFPFDYLQNSTIYINKPLIVSHYSKDRAWVYVYSSFTSGWVKADGIAFLDAKKIKELKQKRYIAITQDNHAIYDKDKNFLFYTKIGMRFCIVFEDKDNYVVDIAMLDTLHQTIFKKIMIPKSVATKEILKLDKNNLVLVLGSISKTKYGWGGLYEDRDCSSTLRDLFTPFGIWLPRNSSKQARVGNVISFEGLNEDEKIALIKKEAIPFETLLYKRGHILLYVGVYNDKVIVFHNTWGIKTKKDGIEGRLVIGKSIFSTLKVGKYLKNYDKDAQLLKNLKSMNIITSF